MPIHAKHRFNVEEYYRMAEAGVINPSGQFELLDGQVLDRFRISPLHAAVTRRLTEFFVPLDEGYIVSVHGPVRLNDYSELQPDLALLKYISNYYKTGHPAPEDVYFLIEVADFSLDYDREEKLPAYARAGIPEVWIVNLPDSAIEIYREPNFTGYEKKTVVRAGEKAAPSAFPNVAVDVAELLRK